MSTRQDESPPPTFEPIAICGIALRLPGGISTPSQFWEFLVNKKDARGPIPETRYKASSFYSKSGKPGFVASQYGYFLDDSVDLGALDTSFFSMPKSEVERVDPQQRLLLELAWECFESAGETDYRGKAIGAYIGSFGEDWAENFSKDTNLFGPYKVAGYGEFAGPNRISYEYDLRGPSMSIRTACSAGLIGLHEACLAIQNGDCCGALVGGCNLIMSPGMTVSMTEQGILSPDGSCKTFDATANGYARGEAINLLYVKKLSDALRDGNPIRAVIRGTSINADGKTTGMSVPNPISHEVMIRRAYSVAGLQGKYCETAFVECHGTGTPTGDPIETMAVGNVFGDLGVFIGSVKANVGHSEGASGITSVVKAILALENHTIPPNIKFVTPNPKIPFKEKKLMVPTEPVPWPANRMERISVNSFGIGGANAHVVLESASQFLASMQNENSQGLDGIHKLHVSMKPRLHLTPFSANTADSLRRQVERHQQYLAQNPGSLADVAYTLATRRVHLPHRAYALMRQDGTEALKASPPARAPSTAPKVVMIFTGQGAQWPQMGMELMHSHSTFASSIRRMDDILQGLADAPTWTIENELLASPQNSNIKEAYMSQPLCTALQIGLADILLDVGVQPYAVIGHSSGEIAAAYASGKLTCAEAITTAFYRGVVSSEVRTPGSMAAVGMSWAETAAYLLPGASIACENSPSSVTVSGDTEAVENSLERIREAKPGVFCRRLKVDTAYHSHHMKVVGAKYSSLIMPHMADESRPAQYGGDTLFFSSVTGTQLPASAKPDARYWQDNLESPVLFSKAVSSLMAHHAEHRGPNSPAGLVFLEVGPHGALGGPLRQILSGPLASTFPYKSCLTRSQDAEETLLSTVGWLWTQGVALNLKRLTNRQGEAKVVTDLPLYPWQHNHSLLLETRITKAWRFRKYPKHELLGVRVVESTDNDPAFHNVLLLEHVAWLRDHVIKGDVIFPGAGYIGMIGEAARQLSEDAGCKFWGFQIRNLVIDMAMILHESKPMEILTSLRKERLTDSLDGRWWDFTITSHNGVTWMKHCFGQLQIMEFGNKAPETTLLNHRDTAKLPRHIDSSAWYRTLSRVGGDYGPYFQGLKNLSSSTTDCIAESTTCRTSQDDDVFYPVHPTQIDNFLQLLGVASVKGLAHKVDKMTVPTSIEHIQITANTQEADLHITASASASIRGSVCGGGRGVTASGQLVLEIAGVKLNPLGNDDLEDDDPHAGARLFWGPDINFLEIPTLIGPFEDRKSQFCHIEPLYCLCVQEALKRLEGVTTDVPHLNRFHTWMTTHCPPTTTSHTLKSLAQNHPGILSGPIATALMKVLDNIVPIFKSEVEPVDVLLSDNTLTDVYNTLRMTNRSRLFQSLGHSKPNLRILEIGAGTGGTTGSVLAGLAHSATGIRMYQHYDYTDISAGFFDEAKAHFERYPGVRYRTLDISEDPILQGFEHEAYDLIIASNVLHTTPSLKQSLINARKLLHPEGTLYLEELCSDIKIFNFIMGVLPGWWLGVDDGRVNEPYVSPERWDEELCQAGFGGLHSVTYDSAPPHQLLAFMTAKPSLELARMRAATILYDKTSLDIAEELKSRMIYDGYQVSLCSFSDKEVPLDSDLISVVDVPIPFFENISSSSYEDFHQLMSRLSDSERGAGILWLTRSSQLSCSDPRWAQIIGAARTIRGEMAVDIATCELDEPSLQAWTTVSRIFHKFQQRRDDDSLLPEYEYAVSDGIVYIPRAFPINVTEELARPKPGGTDSERSARDLKIGRYGRLKTLNWAPRAHQELQGDEVAVETKAVGMNFKDVLIAMGIVDATTEGLGLEMAGIIRDVGPDAEGLAVGDRVFVFGSGCFSTHLITSRKYCAKIPDSLSFEDAATMPCVYSTALHALLDIGRLEAGQTVLIHSACGGVGLAAIQVSKMVGAEIYCTVGSEEKARHLEVEFSIPRTRIFNSREPSFLSDVISATDGRGVDLVLNSLSGELLHASWKCVAEFGTMVEIGKRDLIGNGKLDLNVFEANRSYHGVDLGLLIQRRPQEATRLLKRIVELYEQDHIGPIHPVQVFAATAIEEAFRYMQKGQHIGKLIVSMDPTEEQQDFESTTAPRGPIRIPQFDGHASYLLVGGLGGLGRVVSTWMVENGARHIVYLSRSASTTDEHQAFFEELRSQGCSVTTVRGSVVSLSDVETALSAAPTPIRGVLNMTMVLGDKHFGQMSWEEWTKAVEPKVRGTWNLHSSCLSRGIDLDFFALFSSISAIIGQRAQANYAGANSFLDAFVKYRHGLGLRAGSLAIGLMTDHGVMAESPMLRDRLISQGNYGLEATQLLDAIGTAINVTPVSEDGQPCPTPLVIGLRSVVPLDDPSNRVIWKRDRRMAIYHNRSPTADDKGSNNKGASSGATTSKLEEFLLSARLDPKKILGGPDAATFIAKQIGKQLMDLLLRPTATDDDIDVSKSLQDAGLDSLVAIELRSWWRRTFGFDVSVLEVLNMGSLLDLGERAIRGLKDQYGAAGEEVGDENALC